MKHLIIFFLMSLSISSVFGQSIDITYKVTNYTVNGENFDHLALSGDVTLSFYMCDDNTLCFTNHWRASDSQSYGSVHALKKREIAETSTTHAATEIKFTWHFFNTYDNNRGNAAVTITNIFIGNTVKFIAEIIVLDSNEILELQGYLE